MKRERRLFPVWLIAGALGSTTTTAIQAQTAPAEAPYVMPVPSTAGMVSNRVTGGTLQTALERYPEIVAGRDAEGTYAVVLLLNADGSVYASDMRFTTHERVLLVDEEMNAALPPDTAGSSNTTGYNKGTQLPGGGTLRNDLRLSTRVLPADFDPSRSLAVVQKAVEAKHGSLMHDPLQGDIALVTVLMTDDGRIARDHVEHIKREDLRVKLPREAEARHFAVLGAQPDELGRIGMGFVSRRTGDQTPAPMRGFDNTLQPGGVRKMLMVLYAWPRRAGDPPLSPSMLARRSIQPTTAVPAPGQFLPAARMSAQSGLGSASFNEQSRRVEDRALTALLETYPELLRGAGREGIYTAALTLSPDGRVFRSGLRFSSDPAESSRHMQELSPLLHQGGVTSMNVHTKNELLPTGARLPNELRFHFTVLPLGQDEARAELLVREAVMASHAHLLLPASSGTTNLLTVMMTDDGRIARHAVQSGPLQETMRGFGRPGVPDLAVLDIRTESIGVHGWLTVSQMDAPTEPGNLEAARMLGNRRQLMVRYAWPRRAGEPVGGFQKPPQDPSGQDETARLLAAQRNQATALATRYFPEVLADPVGHAAVRPWVLLSNEGSVLRTGQAALGQDESFLASVQLGRQMPGARFAEVEFHRVAAPGGRPVNVAFVWLAAGSTVP